jgi:hypothetical protein
MEMKEPDDALPGQRLVWIPVSICCEPESQGINTESQRSRRADRDEGELHNVQVRDGSPNPGPYMTNAEGPDSRDLDESDQGGDDGGQR